MFGNNPTRKLAKSDGALLHVQEVFSTIQGEGPYAGLPATFIRLWGCHLQCYFCDTDFESNNPAMYVEELVAEASSNNHRLVVLTGGEPMRQNIQPLCDALHESSHLVQVETAGSFYFQTVFRTRPPSVVVSPKTATVHAGLAQIAQAWKYIISDEDELDTYDGLPIVDFQHTGNKAALAKPPQGTPPEFVWLQPMDPAVKYTDRIPPFRERSHANTELCVALAKKYGYRVSIQQHKILGVP